MKQTEPHCLAYAADNDAGLEEGFFGQHMGLTELDAEFLSRIEPTRLKDLSAFNGLAWFGYRFLHPGLRVYLFANHYQKAHRRTAKMLGKRWAQPSYMRSNPFDEARKQTVTGFVTATLMADAHGVPYDIWCDTIMEQSLRAEIVRPPQPHQMYSAPLVNHVLDKWAARNKDGIYIARAPQYLAENYAGNPWQDAYIAHLCEIVSSKGNRPFWIGRLIYSVGHLREDHAVLRFGASTVEEAAFYK